MIERLESSLAVVSNLNLMAGFDQQLLGKELIDRVILDDEEPETTVRGCLLVREGRALRWASLTFSHR